MRILRLRFRNLNSLAGEWCIDFSHPAYASSGIFAITGPTGSGKTTILDAICLALYGQTPRLKSISKGTNEIMTRGTGECFAEVTYESQVGQFSVHWSQWRARKKPEGELQPPKHEISDLRTKRVLETKLTRVLEKVIETTGLDYHQFTRSILLAQGDFATFLNASPDERAPILEKITGTEIYSDISRKVHERNTDEVGSLAEIQKHIENLDLLSPEVERDLKEQYRRTEEEVEANGKKRAVIHEAVSWLKGINRLTEEIGELEWKKTAAEKKRRAAADDLEHLSRARKTRPFEDLYSKMVHTRDSFNTVEDEVQDLKNQLAIAVPAHEAAIGKYQARKKELETLQEERGKGREVTTRVRDLDTRIQECRKEPGEKRKQLNSIQERVRDIQCSLNQTEQEKAGLTRELKIVVSYLGKQKADSRLTADLSGLEQRLLQYSRLSVGIVENTSLCRKQDDALHGFEQALKATQDALSEKERELLAAGTALQSMQAEFDLTLDYHGVAFWRACESSLNKRRNTLESLIKVNEAVTRSDRRIEALRQERDAWNRELEIADAELANLKHEQQLQEEKVTLLEINLDLIRRVEDLEEERERLEDGTPCPLCGSTDHPYARDNIPKGDPVRQKLEKNRSDLRGITGRIEAKVAAISKVNAEIQSNERKECEREEEIRVLLEGADMGFDDIRSMTRVYDMAGMLGKALRACDIHYSLCHDICAYANEREPSLTGAKEKITILKDTLAGLGSACIRAETERDKCISMVQDLKERIRADAALIEEFSPGIRFVLQSYGLDPLFPEDLGRIIPELEERKTAYEAHLSGKERLTKEIEQRSIEIAGYRKRIEEHQESEGVLSSAIAVKEKELMALSDERTGLFGEKDPVVEEREMETRVRSAEEVFREVSKKVTEHETKIKELKEQVSQKTLQLDGLRVSLDSLETAFAAGTRDAGFADEADFIAPRLPHDRFMFLDNLERSLLLEEKTIQSSIEEKHHLREQEQAKAVTDKSLDVIGDEDRECEETITNLNRTLGSIGERLKKQNEMMAVRRDLMAKLAKQEAECARWQNLHNLIGSADGAKFRKFAQGLTFDRMIAHANRHLRKMSDRYLLIRRPDSALELDIMDHYHAGELRTTKNLSGGESFIVSLALALGLSGMASRNVRIDSLFLDEGFGTLDDETLSTALETLSNLQQEGKVIGIISHVPALKERISTQIVVEKTTGGRSRLKAPGCRLIRS